MPVNTKEAGLKTLSDADYARLAKELDDLGITDKIDASFRFSSRILGCAVDFMKNIGVLNEFAQSLSGYDKLTFIEMFTNRPKIYGGNPFE